MATFNPLAFRKANETVTESDTDRYNIGIYKLIFSETDTESNTLINNSGINKSSSNNLTNSVDITFNNKVIGNYELSKLYLMIDCNNEFKIISLESNQSGVYAYDIIANETIIDLSSDKLEKIDFLEEEINESIDINVLYEKCSEYLCTNKTK